VSVGFANYGVRIETAIGTLAYIGGTRPLGEDCSLRPRQRLLNGEISVSRH
jgi:hypothetical protein